MRHIEIHKEKLLFFFFICSGLFSYAQEIDLLFEKGNYFKAYEIRMEGETSLNVEPGGYITALSLLSEQSFEGQIRIKVGNDFIFIREDHHDHITGKYEGFIRSELIEFEHPLCLIELEFTGKVEHFVLHTYDARLNIMPFRNTRSDPEFCSKPASIDQSVWRAGLPDPKPNPDFTQTEHCVIHHSAGSNYVSNYLERVRNIYLLHTETNGWDDIGYNYLIAPDGSIYDGRDGQGQVEDDYVKGAHFCGKNSNTMGICMLGTYSDTMPSDTAIKALESLLSWKLYKDGLHPMGSLIHPKSSGSLLPVICGHRDGCATECPGDSLYALLNKIRNDVLVHVDSCGGISSQVGFVEENFHMYPNPVENRLFFDPGENNNLPYHAVICDLLGRRFFDKRNISGQVALDVSRWPSGMYILKVQNDENAYLDKLIIKR